MPDTPNLGLPQIGASQSQKHVTHNEALVLLDAVVHLAVKGQRQTPPTSPVEGDRFIVAESPGGVFGTHDQEVAIYANGGWVFAQPQNGWLAFDELTGNRLSYFNGKWKYGERAPTGAGFASRSVEELVSVSGATTNTTVFFPDRAIVLGVSTKVATAITGATSFDCGTPGEQGKFGGYIGAVKDSSNIGVIGPSAVYEDTFVQLVPRGGTFTGGEVVVTLHYLEFSQW